MKFRFPIVIIDEDFRSDNTSGLGIRALADAIEKEGFEADDLHHGGIQSGDHHNAVRAGAAVRP